VLVKLQKRDSDMGLIET